MPSWLISNVLGLFELAALSCNKPLLVLRKDKVVLRQKTFFFLLRWSPLSTSMGTLSCLPPFLPQEIAYIVWMWLGMSESTWQPLVPQDIVPFYSTWIGHSAFSFFHCSTRHIRQPIYRTNTPKKKFSSPAEPISSGKLGFQHQVSLSLI